FNFISYITFLSILGIIIGNASLVAVQSIFNGFQELTLKQIVGIDPHIRLIPQKGNFINLNDIDIEKIKDIGEINFINPTLQSKVVAVHNSKMQVFNLIGLEPNSHLFKDELPRYLISGSFGIFNKLSEQTIFIGSALAERLQVAVGESIELFTPNSIEGSLLAFSQPRGYTVSVGAIINTNIKDYDLTLAFISSSDLKHLLSIPANSVNSIDIFLKDFQKADEIKAKLSNILLQDVKIQTWKELNSQLYSIMKFEKLVSFAIVGIIIIIAVFNLFASLSMTITEKQQDIATLKAIGANDKLIKKIFLKVGLFIGVISTILGLLLGIGFVYAQSNYKWFKIDINRYIIDAIPVSLNIWDVLIVAFFSILLCFLATIYPAHQAMKINIAEELRND
ncbi:MAG TPA: ABC transporter permease, partial [Candidatus Kapabacteria bacterium]|nr:ABC transporter permease [Candidatus Kapabacteria bacterium]